MLSRFGTTTIIIIIIIHEFQSDASPEELQGRCSVTVFSLWLWPVTRTAERPDKQLSHQSAPKTVDSRQRQMTDSALTAKACI